MAVSIVRPAAEEAAAVVRPGTGAAFICARGTATDDEAGPAAKQGAQKAAPRQLTSTRVCALVYLPADTPDASPPPGAPCEPVSNFGEWSIAQVPMPATAREPCVLPPGPYPSFKLFVWHMAGTTVLGTAEVDFCGRCADQTDCGPGAPTHFCGSGGSGSGTESGGNYTTPPMETAPLQWSMTVKGFLGARAVFNGRWKVSLRDETGGDCVWDNNGRGKVPLVELRCEGPNLSVWRLTFRHKQKVATYSRSAVGWNNLGPNVFVAPKGAHGMPSSVTVVPV